MALAAPFLVGAAPIVALWAANRLEFPPSVLLPLLLAVALLAAVALVVGRALTRPLGVRRAGRVSLRRRGRGLRTGVGPGRHRHEPGESGASRVGRRGRDGRGYCHRDRGDRRDSANRPLRGRRRIARRRRRRRRLHARRRCEPARSGRARRWRRRGGAVLHDADPAETPAPAVAVDGARRRTGRFRTSTT